VDDHGHVVDRDDPGLSKCLHHPKEKIMSKTPPAPTAKEALVEVAVQETPADEAPPDEIADEEQPPPLPAPPATPRVAPSAHIAVPSTPDTTLAEVKSLAGADGGSIITVLLAAIGVLGGGAGWKFYQSYAKQKHAERMKQLEIEATRVVKVEAVNAERAADLAEAARVEHKDDSHQKCSAERVALQSKVEALEARLADAEKAAHEAAEAAKAATVTAEAIEKPKEITIDFDEIEQRIAEIEKALKKAPPIKSEKKPAKKGAKKDG